MKKIIVGICCLPMLCFTLSVNVFAAAETEPHTGEHIDVVTGSPDSGQQIQHPAWGSFDPTNIEDVYGVVVSWGDLTYRYASSSWNYKLGDEHGSYESGTWTAIKSGGDEIAVTNYSNFPVTVDMTFLGDGKYLPQNASGQAWFNDKLAIFKRAYSCTFDLKEDPNSIGDSISPADSRTVSLEITGLPLTTVGMTALSDYYQSNAKTHIGTVMVGIQKKTE